MPDWKDPAVITVFGKPRLFLASRRAMWIRCSPAIPRLSGIAAMTRMSLVESRPQAGAGRLVYCNLIKAVYKDVPL